MLFQHVGFTNLTIVRNNVCCLNHGPYTILWGLFKGFRMLPQLTMTLPYSFMYSYALENWFGWNCHLHHTQSDSYGKS